MNDYKGRAMTPLAEQVTQRAGTERPFTGLYTDVDTPGVYRCIVCGATLFDSRAKFHSGCGWPSFDDAVDNAAVKLIEDNSHGMVRTEVRCAKCNAHLGHLFDDGPTATGQRYCINSVAIDLDDAAR